MGWDQSLQDYFLIVFKPYVDKNRPFYSSITSNNGERFKILAPLLEILNTLAILVPQEMIDEVMEDGKKNIGNKNVFHSLTYGFYKRSDIFDAEIHSLLALVPDIG